jgi:hypothetical protein
MIGNPKPKTLCLQGLAQLEDLAPTHLALFAHSDSCICRPIALDLGQSLLSRACTSLELHTTRDVLESMFRLEPIVTLPSGLQHLHLSATRISSSDLRSLCSYLVEACPEIRSLRFMNLHPGDLLGETVPHIKCPSLEALYFDNVSTVGIEHVLAVLELTPSLRQVHNVVPCVMNICEDPCIIDDDGQMARFEGVHFTPEVHWEVGMGAYKDHRKKLELVQGQLMQSSRKVPLCMDRLTVKVLDPDPMTIGRLGQLFGRKFPAVKDLELRFMGTSGLTGLNGLVRALSHGRIREFVTQFLSESSATHHATEERRLSVVVTAVEDLILKFKGKEDRLLPGCKRSLLEGRNALQALEALCPGASSTSAPSSTSGPTSTSTPNQSQSHQIQTLLKIEVDPKVVALLQQDGAGLDARLWPSLHLARKRHVCVDCLMTDPSPHSFAAVDKAQRSTTTSSDKVADDDEVTSPVTDVEQKRKATKRRKTK